MTRVIGAQGGDQHVQRAVVEFQPAVLPGELVPALRFQALAGVPVETGAFVGRQDQAAAGAVFQTDLRLLHPDRGVPFAERDAEARAQRLYATEGGFDHERPPGIGRHLGEQGAAAQLQAPLSAAEIEIDAALRVEQHAAAVGQHEAPALARGGAQVGEQAVQRHAGAGQAEAAEPEAGQREGAAQGLAPAGAGAQQGVSGKPGGLFEDQDGFLGRRLDGLRLLRQGLQIGALQVAAAPAGVDQALGDGGQQGTRLADGAGVLQGDDLGKGFRGDVGGVVGAAEPGVQAPDVDGCAMAGWTVDCAGRGRRLRACPAAAGTKATGRETPGTKCDLLAF